MAKVSIPVDLYNPGQVFACMGLLEAADQLFGSAEGGFEWKGVTFFQLSVQSDTNPIAKVLDFLASADAIAISPTFGETEMLKTHGYESSHFYPAKSPDELTLPVMLMNGVEKILLSHWSDGTEQRDNFKLYSGNRSALKIAQDMLKGNGKKGLARTEGVSQLWSQRKKEMLADPFGIVCPMGGSFNFDPRGAWKSLDAGYSLNDMAHKVQSSPLVELLAALGMEYARPAKLSNRIYRYGVWEGLLPPLLARVALSGELTSTHLLQFRFQLELSGKNKIVSYSIKDK